MRRDTVAEPFQQSIITILFVFRGSLNSEKNSISIVRTTIGNLIGFALILSYAASHWMFLATRNLVVSVHFYLALIDRIFELKLKFAAEAAESNIARPCSILMLEKWGVHKMFEK